MPVSLKEKIYTLLWDTETEGRAFVLRFGTSALRLVAAVLRDLREGDLRQRAKGLVYMTLLSLAPLLALSFSVLKGFGVHNQLEPFLNSLLTPLGENSVEIATRIVTFVENVRVGVLGAIGLCVLIFGVVALMGEIEKAFNDIWRVKKPRTLPARIKDYLSVLLIGPFLIFVSVAVSAGVRHMDIMENWVGRGLVDTSVAIIGPLFAWALFVIAFAALYIFMPNTRVRLGPAVVAGMITGVMWKVLGWLFGFFVQGSANYEAIYSAFAILILFMIWLYAGWLVVLAGASVSYYLQNPSNRRLSRRAVEFSPRVQEKIALQVCAEVSKAFYRQEPPPSSAILAQQMTIPVLAVEKVTETLVKAGILAYTGVHRQDMIPARPFDATSVEEMLKAYRAADESQGLNADHVDVSPVVTDFLKKREKALTGLTEKTTLKDLGGKT